MKQFSIPVSMLRQYCFCPRIPYYYLIRQIRTHEQPWLTLGTDEHKRQEQLIKRRNLSKFGISSDQKWIIKNNVELYSEKYGLHGICDAVVETEKGIFLLEFKNSNSISMNFGAQIQLVAYSMIYEEMMNNKVNFGFILYGSKAKTFELKITNEMKEKVIQTRDEILDIADKGNLPNSPASEKKCSQCEYFNYCADRF
ncbi:MAG: CRISPR-associated protein Cas4 [Succinivibrio sp.]